MIYDSINGFSPTFFMKAIDLNPDTWPWYLRVKGTSEHRGTSQLLHSLHVKNHFYCVGWFVTITYGILWVYMAKCHVIIIGGLLLPWCPSNMDDHSLDHPSYPSYIIISYPYLVTPSHSCEVHKSMISVIESPSHPSLPGTQGPMSSRPHETLMIAGEDIFEFEAAGPIYVSRGAHQLLDDRRQGICCE